MNQMKVFSLLLLLLTKFFLCYIVILKEAEKRHKVKMKQHKL